jgi:hypothetical protein
MRRRQALKGAVLVLTAATAALAAQSTGWQANPRVVEQQSAKQKEFNYDEARVGAVDLPDPLKSGSTTIKTPAAWSKRRAEILTLFRDHVYGRSPGPPERLRFETVQENASAMAGTATLKRVAIVSTHKGRQHRFELTMFVPNAVKGRVPLFLLMNNRPPSNVDPTRAEKSGFWPAEEVIGRGYAIAAFQVGDLAPDNKDTFREGVIELFENTTTGPRDERAWGALAAWAWGARRAMDYFVTDARIDPKRVVVIGHSRGGKAALWAGAEDERFAIVVSNESGEGGAALSRRHFGETLARITDTFPHWFAGKYRSFAGRPEALPVDQHMLLSLVAPRAVYVASADEDLWSDPRGEFLSLAYSSPVFALWGDPRIAADAMPPLEKPLVAGRRGYHVRSGVHNLTPYDWQRFVDFAESLWKP